jgi:hypothetical protein
MPSPRLPRVKPGDWPTAEHVNAPNAELDRQRLFGGSGVLVGESPTGTVLSTKPKAPEFWAKITSGGSGAKYAWVEQVPQAGGTWADGSYSGSVADDPAYETTGNTSVAANKIVWLRFSTISRTWLFLYSACS